MITFTLSKNEVNQSNLVFTLGILAPLLIAIGLGLGAIYQAESTPKGGASKGTVPSITRVDAAAYYQLRENLRLQVNIENLLNEEYYPHAYDDHQFTVGAPINATLSIKGTF